MISAAEADTGPAWWPAEVISREPRSPRVTVLTLRTGQQLPYLPGQHIAVQTPRWPRVWRRYWVANAPRSGGGHADGVTLTLHVSVVPGGLVSTALRHAAPGDTLVLGPAEGTMTADLTSGRDVLCLAGGTGLAPAKAMIEALLAADGASGEGTSGEGMSGERGPGTGGPDAGTGTGPRVTLYFGARTQADLYDLPALRAMERACPRLEVLPATSGERSPYALYDTIADLAPDACWQGRDVYISGPDDMITSTVRRLLGRGAPDERLHYDLSPDQPLPSPAVTRAARYGIAR
jgi:NAD(P)H-flavin reductase